MELIKRTELHKSVNNSKEIIKGQKEVCTAKKGDKNTIKKIYKKEKIL